MDISVTVAAHAGACYGVDRALKLAEGAAREQGVVHTLGPLIHNPLVVDELSAQGVSLAHDLDDIPSGAVIIRSHGVAPEVIEHARELKLDVIDATCPYVKKVHRAVGRLAAEGYEVLVLGESGHPEVEGIVGHAPRGATVIGCAEDLEGLELSPRVGVVVQTTQTERNLEEVAAALVARVRELKVVNTICLATSERQSAAAELAATSDVMIVVGGKNSGNTRRLAEICAATGTDTHHIEDARELDASWIADGARIGITAGASTPASHIDRVVMRLNALAEQA